jgi:hypothetical protein
MLIWHVTIPLTHLVEDFEMAIKSVFGRKGNTALALNSH